MLVRCGGENTTSVVDAPAKDEGEDEAEAEIMARKLDEVETGNDHMRKGAEGDEVGPDDREHDAAATGHVVRRGSVAI